MVYVLVVLGTYLVSSLDFLFIKYTQEAEEKVIAVKNIYERGRTALGLGGSPASPTSARGRTLSQRFLSDTEAFLQGILDADSPGYHQSLLEVMLAPSEDPEVQKKMVGACLRRALDSGVIDHN